MVDRMSLLITLVKAGDPTSTQREAIRKSLDAALSAAIMAVPLSSLRQLTDSQLTDLEATLRDTLPAPTVAKLAEQWEPLRKVDSTVKESLRRDLADLLRGRRAPFKPPSLTLDEARQLSEEQRTRFERILAVAPGPVLKSLVGQWDKHLKPQPTGAAARARLTELLAGRSPAAPPPPKRRGGRPAARS